MKKGQISLYILFIFSALIIIMIGAVVAPMGNVFVSKLYVAGDKMLQISNKTIQNISDPVMRGHINDVLDTAMMAQENNIEVTAAIYQYSWIVVLGLVALIMFIYTRQLVELGGGFV